jgi:hypothetical protein
LEDVDCDHHLLLMAKKYVEESFEKSLRGGRDADAGHVPLEEMALVLGSTGYVVRG